MENGEITAGKDGLYAVCFKNFKDLSEEKVREMFSRYGNVVNIRFLKQEAPGGLVFVRYRTLEETKSCLEGFLETKELNVRMAFNKTDQQNGTDQKIKSDTNKSKEGATNNKGAYRKNGENHYGNQTGFKKGFEKNFRQNNGQNKSFRSDTESQHSDKQNSWKNHDNSSQNSHQYGNKGKKKTFFNSEYKTGGDDVQKLNGLLQDSLHIGNTEQVATGQVNGRRSTTASVHNGSTNSDERNDVCPPLADFNDVPPFLERKPEVLAEDVIIANLPVGIKEDDILQLARRKSLYPIHISPVERTGLKYNI
ncbi:probable ATP-dependent RNA helicase ddx42 isoform X2 [Periplaneta americana]